MVTRLKRRERVRAVRLMVPVTVNGQPVRKKEAGATLKQRMYLFDLRQKCGLDVAGIRDLSAVAASAEISLLVKRVGLQGINASMETCDPPQESSFEHSEP